MKKIPIVLPICIALIVIGAIFFCGVHEVVGPTEYLNRTIPAIVAHWDLNELRRYSGKRLLDHLDGDPKKDFQILFAKCREKLGSCKG